MAIRRFKVTPPAAITSEEGIRGWALPFCSATGYIYMSLDGNGSLIVELNGDFTAPNAQEVTNG